MLRDESIGVEATWCGVGTEGGVAAEGAVASEAGASDRCAQLHRKLKRIVKARGALDAQEAAALREADALRLWRHYGYSSLLEYMEMEMGYTPRMALERLRVAKAIEELPVIAQKMEQGDLSFSAARELTRVATAETEAEWIEAADDKNARQVEELVSGHQPGDKPSDPVDPKLRKTRLRYDDIVQETKAMLREAKQILERELGDRLSDDAFLRTFARMVIDGAASPERTRAPYQIATTICEQCKRGWQDGGGITVEMSPPTLAVALCDAQHIGRVDEAAEQPGEAADPLDEAATDPFDEETIAREEPARTHSPHSVGSVAPQPHATSRGVATTPHSVGSVAPQPHGFPCGVARTAGPDNQLSKPLDTQGRILNTRVNANSPREVKPKRYARGKFGRRAKSDIPPALRRAIRARDHGKCCVPWCRSSRNVDQHHLVPICEGGEHTLENILSLCESHHIAHHAGALIIEGTGSNPKFTRRAHNAFAIAERAVETARALKTLGFDKREVKSAMDRTRTHVGTSELTLQQWIVIALSYCPKPIAK
jgi:5-methylcytosine-specific restriction endonuclease McrA